MKHFVFTVYFNDKLELSHVEGVVIANNFREAALKIELIYGEAIDSLELDTLISENPDVIITKEV